MKYNAKYDRWVSKEGLVYRYDDKNDKLVLLKIKPHNGYERVSTKEGYKFVHRVVYETFVGEVSQGYEIDHINTNRDDNRLENLRCVTHKENSNNQLTRKHFSEALKGNDRTKGKLRSEFGEKFKSKFGITFSDDKKLYVKEHTYYRRHKVCRWEVEECKS